MNEKFSLRYCISCERIVATLDGEFHTNVITPETRWDAPELVTCYSPFTLSTPPDNFDPDWDLTVEEPSQEELAEMNLNAEILLQDFELE